MAPAIGGESFDILNGDVTPAHEHVEVFTRRGEAGVGVVIMGTYPDPGFLLTWKVVAQNAVKSTYETYKDLCGSDGVSVTNTQGSAWSNVLLKNVELLSAEAVEGVVGAAISSGALMLCRWEVRQLG